MSLLFTPNVYKEPPLVRGVYFTSGTQEGRPIDRVMASMAEAFGVAPQLPAQEPVVEQKSYFLRDMFMNVVFPDRQMAGKTRLAASSQRRRAIVIGATVFGISALFATLPAWSFVQNRLLISSTAKIVSDVAKHRSSSGGAAVTLAQLEPLRARADLLRQYEEESPPPALRFGLYHGNLLYPHVKALYADVLKKDVLEPIVNSLGAQLEEYGRAPDDGTYDPGNYERFKLYLLLTGPKGPGEPAVTGKLREWAVTRIVSAWAGLLGTQPVPEMNAYVSLYFDLALTDPALALPRDLALVQRLRVVLADVPLERVLIDPLVADMSAQGYDLTLEKILGGPTGPLKARKVVRGAFTKDAWKAVFKPSFENAATILEPWVLGGTIKKDPEKLAEELRSRYFELYINEWRGFLDSISIPTSKEDVVVLSQLQALTRGVPKPYERLMRAVAENTRLVEPDKTAGIIDKAAGAAAKKAGKAGGAAIAAARGAMAEGDDGLVDVDDVESEFEPFVRFGVPPPPPPALPGATAPPPPASVALDSYYEQVVFARDTLASAIETPAARGELSAKMKTIASEARAIIQQQEVGWRPLFERLFFAPVDNAARALRYTTDKDKGLPWCNEVVNAWDPNFKGRYPFSPSGHDASLKDVITFYAPGGIWQAHFDEKLAGAVQRMGDKYEFIGDTELTASLLTFLTRSLEITSVLFPPGAKDAPLVEFEVRIRPSPQVSQIQLEIDGKSITARNEPDRWHKFKWPGEGKQGGYIRVKGAQNLSETIAQEGEWGFFRLLEQGKVEASVASRQFSVTWTLSSRAGVSITFDIKPARSESPFFGLSRRGSGKLFNSFRGPVAPPHSIGPGMRCAVN
jgi:type VI secretion system protein ImpL